MRREVVRINDLLQPFEELLGSRPEPELLTLTEKRGFMAQSEKYNKRVARDDTSDYKVIRKHDIAFNPYLLWAGAIAQNVEWEMGLISPLYPTFHIRDGYDPRFVDYLLGGEPLRLRYDTIAFGSVPRKRRTSISDFLNLEIPKPPPLAEQRRIAEVLDRAEALRAKRRAALAQLDSLTQSLFLDLFGDPATNPKGWPVQKIESLSTRVTKGESPHWQGFGYEPAGVRFITSENVGWGKMIVNENKFISEQFNRKLIRSQVSEDDLLINLVGASIGRACLAEKKFLPGNVNQAVAVVSLDTTKVFRPFVLAQILTPQIQKRLLGERVEAARANVSLINIRALELVVPPITLQREFARRVTAVEALKTAQRASLAELDALFATLQHRAFRGEL